MSFFSTLTSKLIAAGILLVILLGAVLWFGAHERGIGGAKVQAKWDLAKAAQTTLALRASETARTTEHQQATDFAGIEAGYLQATAHAYPTLSTALPAALAAGTMQLRHDCPGADRSGMSQATAHSRELDAAATQALADRVATAVAAVHAGDASDARERRLSAQVTALQAVIRAERTPVVVSRGAFP